MPKIHNLILEVIVITIIVEKITEKLIESSIEYTQKSINEFIEKLGNYKNEDGQEERINLPTAGIIGIGRCGTNIALNVANAIYEARSYYSEIEGSAYESSKPSSSFMERLSLRQKKNDKNKGLFLVDPVILAADLDKDTQARIKQLNPNLIDGRLRFMVTDLDWLHGGGAGNIPVVGQYMAMLSLMINNNSKINDNWRRHKAYLIETSGLTINQSRLYFYLFSCGGGSGSGMASIFGTAQQRAFLINIQRELNVDSAQQKVVGSVQISEPICSVGIGVLPDIPDGNSPASAQHYNAGRMLCQFLAQQNAFDLYFGKEVGDGDKKNFVRMFNCLLLVSNDIMKHAFKEQSGQPISAVLAEGKANTYIGQQIFNLLTSQALIGDYVNQDDKFRKKMQSAGISLGDTVKLDANDLNNSLSGPTAIAYSEQIKPKEEFGEIFFRAINPPKINSDDNFIQGISILPTKYEKYIDLLEQAKSGQIDEIKNLPLFKHAFSVVVIISAPTGDELTQQNLVKIKKSVDEYFPSAKIKRYAFVLATSEKVSLTLLISGSACSTYNVYYNIKNYLYSCFKKPEVELEEFNDCLNKTLSNAEFSFDEFSNLLHETEQLDNILVGIGSGMWQLTKLQHEQKFASFIQVDDTDQREKAMHPSKPVVELDEMMLKVDDIKQALHYVHRLEHRKQLAHVDADRY